MLRVGCAWMGPAPLDGGDGLGSLWQRASIFFPKLLCLCPRRLPTSWGRPRTKDPARAESRDRKRVRKVPGEGVLSRPCRCSFPQPRSSKVPLADSGQGGPVAPCPAPGAGRASVCPSLARAAAFPAPGGNLPIGCSAFLAVNSLLWEVPNRFLAQKSELGKFKEEKCLLGPLKYKDTTLVWEMTEPQVARCWWRFLS